MDLKSILSKKAIYVAQEIEDLVKPVVEKVEAILPEKVDVIAAAKFIAEQELPVIDIEEVKEEIEHIVG